ncbi:MAG: RDD family protein [Clostridiales bacterium]|nr:RDD family protein [Clostridiales bacterium]
MTERKVMKLASRGKRFGAYCIDAVIPVVAAIMFLSSSIAAAMSARYYNGFGGFGFQDPFADPFSGGYGYGYGMNSGLSAGTIVLMIMGMLLSLAFLVIQIVFFTKSKTLGKAALGLQVVSSETGEPIGFWKMLFREWFVKRASAAVFALGYIWVLVDDKNRGWHDKILDTYVVDLKESEILAARKKRQADRAAAAQRQSAAAAASAQRQSAAGTAGINSSAGGGSQPSGSVNAGPSASDQEMQARPDPVIHVEPTPKLTGSDAVIYVEPAEGQVSADDKHEEAVEVVTETPNAEAGPEASVEIVKQETAPDFTTEEINSEDTFLEINDEVAKIAEQAAEISVEAAADAEAEAEAVVETVSEAEAEAEAEAVVEAVNEAEAEAEAVVEAVNEAGTETQENDFTEE